jgi:hypothetical protein
MAIGTKGEFSELLKADLAALFVKEPWYIGAFPCKPLTRWQRFKFWWSAHWPRVHFGPCDHSDCW